MIKVMIADDEEKVCRLIYKLIDWTSLEMEVTSIAYNGMEALEQIKVFNPDIVITDIRMPGCDGLELIQKSKELNEFVEFIIISGYRHFDYAQSAIKYGVNDYLLKPIKKEELMQTLNKMREKYRKKNENSSREEKIKRLLEQSIQKIRSSIFIDLLMQQTEEEKFYLGDINNRYQFQFQEGCFQVIIIKIDHSGDLSKASIEYLGDKVANAALNRIKELCWEIECYFIAGAEYCLLNYKEENKKIIRKQIKALLDEITLQEALFEQVKFTIGIGTAVEKIQKLHQSSRAAELALEQRLIAGTGKIIEEVSSEIKNISANPMFFAFNKSLTDAFERMDAELAKSSVEILKENIFSQSDITGHDVIQAAEEVCNIFISCMRNNQIVVKEAYSSINRFRQQAADCSSGEQLFSFLGKAIADGLQLIAEDKKQEDSRPIRTAKLYIQDHYMNAVTIEEVSNAAGFSATYFSSLFKKETGSTFLEYLSKIRMTAAKDILKKTNLNVAVICEQVGYSDVKYFTKNFKKHTGLKPNEYRKLYS
ncbi:response regulator transcription factor [Robinsoniella sp. KNHs210]|uniref:response regulator transcription factor n=1 Tax=Robinsoniella sp. KNHs210 TaxID=1469950 RepID=UPI000485461F|nr:response regulator [Robinsoniella sp. KNHs210]